MYPTYLRRTVSKDARRIRVFVIIMQSVLEPETLQELGIVIPRQQQNHSYKTNKGG